MMERGKVRRTSQPGGAGGMAVHGGAERAMCQGEIAVSEGWGGARCSMTWGGHKGSSERERAGVWKTRSDSTAYGANQGSSEGLTKSSEGSTGKLIDLEEILGWKEPVGTGGRETGRGNLFQIFLKISRDQWQLYLSGRRMGGTAFHPHKLQHHVLNDGCSCRFTHLNCFKHLE